MTENRAYSRVIRICAAIAVDSLAIYYSKIDKDDINIFAPLLHPSLRPDFVRSWSHSWVNNAVERLENTYNKHYKTNELNIHDSSACDKNNEPSSMLTAREKLKEMRKLRKHRSYRDNVVMKFLNGEIAAEDVPPTEGEELINPLEFWKRKLAAGEHMNGLTSMALDVFSCTSSTVAVEQMFSQAGRFVTPIRSSLRDSSITYLTTIGNWFREGIINAKRLEKAI